MAFIFLSNIVIAIVYLFLFKIFYNENFYIKSVIVAIIPIFGLVFVLIYEIMNKIMVETNETSVNKIFYNFSKDQECKFDFMEFKNIIPLSNCLFIENINKKRRFFYNALSNDFIGIYPILQEALKDSDIEIEHYASTLISSNIRRINEGIIHSKEKNFSSKISKEMCQTYINLLVEYIYIRESETDYIAYALRGELKKNTGYLIHNFENVKEKYYVIKIENEIKLKKYRRALISINQYNKLFGDKVKDGFLKLKVYYEMKKGYHFLNELKKHKGNKSNNISNIVKFWSKNQNYF